ncbi:hypothetical protein ACYSUO_18465 [Streptomyces sp. UC4497]
MNTRAINAASGAILAAQQQGRVAAGIALALDAAGLLNSPEHAAEVAAMRERLAELECGADLGPGYRCQRPAGHSGDCEPTPDPRRSADRLTALLAPTQALREAEMGGASC